jgi:hypothetical protein
MMAGKRKNSFALPGITKIAALLMLASGNLYPIDNDIAGCGGGSRIW